jgi:enterochelin esterase family protein
MTLRPIALLTLAALLGGCTTVRETTGPESFNDFRRTWLSADAADRDTLLAGFWKSVLAAGTPLVQANGTDVVFVYNGPADSVKVTGDFTNWEHRLPMERLGTSELFHRTVTLPRDARLDYLLVLDTGKTLVDPGSPFTVHGGFGPRSEVAMPGFVRSTAWMQRPGLTGGSISTIRHTSLILGYDHTIHVYLPPGYDTTAGRYPVVYFQDGNDYVFYAGARNTFDNLISDGEIRPAIGVFIVPPAQPGRDRLTEYSLNRNYMRFIADELVPFIDRTYRTIPLRAHRLLVGASRGGLITFGLALLHSDLFANAASQSGNLSWNSDSLARLVRSLPRQDVRLLADIGTYEDNLLGQPPADRNFLEGNRRMRDLLGSLGYTLEYREFPDSHSWGRWRNELPRILRTFLPAEQ